jgi:hypothetical protein
MSEMDFLCFFGVATSSFDIHLKYVTRWAVFFS